jgi:UDP-N-acetylmuramate dehydrogenase
MAPLKENQLLSEISTLGIGGPARYYTVAKTAAEMQKSVRFCAQNKIPFLILGKGSNCLFDDRGFEGCVIHNKIDGISEDPPGHFTVGAGYSFSLLGVQTAKAGWSGLEFASGIPASVGGAIYMNAGANACETKDSLTSVAFVDAEGNLTTYLRDEIAFRYRYSAFQDLKGAIAAATFSLTPSESARKKQLGIISYRQRTQPCKEKSAGCIFRNPPGFFAGQLIEAAGLKGLRMGGAQISALHANFFINAGGATSEDFKALIAYAKHVVKEKTDHELESEVRIIPYDFSR